MLTGIHILLTYRCLNQCDHCFLHCGPRAGGTFTLAQLERLLHQAGRIPSVTRIYYEGGEPFLYYGLMLEGVRRATERGFSVGTVTNAYWATTVEDARLWLEPLVRAGLTAMTLSDDAFHCPQDAEDTPAQRAAKAAQELGLSWSVIRTEPPTVLPPTAGEGPDARQGEPLIGGGVMFRGRAVDRLLAGLPRRPASAYRECRREALAEPKRVHVDAYGNVQICQGLSMGNLWERELAEIVGGYDPAAHPICGPLVRGGPAELARVEGVSAEGGFVDECHLCYVVRRALLERYPGLVAPRQAYGLED